MRRPETVEELRKQLGDLIEAVREKQPSLEGKGMNLKWEFAFVKSDISSSEYLSLLQAMNDALKKFPRELPALSNVTVHVISEVEKEIVESVSKRVQARAELMQKPDVSLAK